MYHFFKYPFEGYKPVKYVVNPVRVVEAVLCLVCIALAAAIDVKIHDMHIAFKILLTFTAAAFVIITVYDVIATSYARPIYWNAWTLFTITGALFFFLGVGLIIATGFGHVLLILGVVAYAVTAIIFLLDTILILHAFQKRQNEVYPEEYEPEPVVVISRHVVSEPSKSALKPAEEEKVTASDSKHTRSTVSTVSKETSFKDVPPEPVKSSHEEVKPQASKETGPSQSSHLEPGSSREIDASALSRDLTPGSSREIRFMDRMYETKRTVHGGKLTEEEKIIEQKQRVTTSYGGTFPMSKDATPLPSPAGAPCMPCRTPTCRKPVGVRSSGSQIIKRSTSGNIRRGPDGNYYLSDGTPLIPLQDQNGETLYQDSNGVMYTKDGIPIISQAESYTEVVKESTQQRVDTHKLKSRDGVWYTPDGRRVEDVYRCCDGKLITADGTPLNEIDLGGGSFVYESPQGVLYSSDGTPVGFEDDREKEVNRIYERQSAKYTTKSETKFQERRVGEQVSSEDGLYLCDGTPAKKIETPSGQIMYEYDGQLYTRDDDDDDLPRQGSGPVWSRPSPEEQYESRPPVQTYEPRCIQSRIDSSRQFKPRETPPSSDHSVPRSTRSSTPCRTPYYDSGSDHRSIPRSATSSTQSRPPCCECHQPTIPRSARSLTPPRPPSDQPRSSRSLTPPCAPCNQPPSNRSLTPPRPPSDQPRSSRSLTPPCAPCNQPRSNRSLTPPCPPSDQARSTRSLTPPRAPSDQARATRSLLSPPGHPNHPSEQTPIPRSNRSLTPSRPPCYESTYPLTPATSSAPKLQICPSQKEEIPPTCPYLPKPKPVTPRYCPAQTCMKPQRRPSPPTSPRKERAPSTGSRTVAVSTRMVPKCPLYKQQSQSAPSSPQRRDAPPRPVKSAEPQWQQQPTVVHQQYVQKPCVCGNIHYQQATTVQGTFSQSETSQSGSPPKSPKGPCGKKDCNCQACKSAKEAAEPADKPPLQTISECDVETEPPSRHNIRSSSSSQPTSSEYVPDRTSPSCNRCFICGDRNCLIHTQKETGNDSVQTSETRMLRASDIQKLTSGNLPGTADDYKK
ncbi:uncharacterized protein LOC103314052 [Tribolium castaneum]|uniref:uncharacterized protein LOC103314052 n=1 Tax=Tribolium castaneum TaxID=7070 RepID=UPI0001DCBD04|nr:PREDICTED: uncharacterized protein LOC103314052 [Tribolium castaneum]|eukprot:XP_015838225.1 PREDICTED: uncharacterized protein LOC103314052 [Tribolium castaneum]